MLLVVAACGGDDGGARDGNDNVAGSPGAGGTGGAGAPGGGGAAGMANSCTTAVGTATQTTLYDGALVNGACSDKISAPRNNSWFSYKHDEDPGTQNGIVEAEGADCAYRFVGAGLTQYGAGAGFDLNYSGGTCPFDASAYKGVRLKMKGTATGTSGLDYAAVDNTVRVKFVQDLPAEIVKVYEGDDYGGWCTATSATEWSSCDVLFADAKQEGYSAEVAMFSFDITKLTKIQFQFSKHTDAASVDFNMYFDDVEFITGE